MKPVQWSAKPTRGFITENGSNRATAGGIATISIISLPSCLVILRFYRKESEMITGKAVSQADLRFRQESLRSDKQLLALPEGVYDANSESQDFN